MAAQIERTLLVLRGKAAAQVQRVPIEARLSSTGFSIIAETLLEYPPHAELGETGALPLGCAPGRNLVTLLQRSRAIQALRELVGPEDSGLPGSSGNLRAMYGKDAVWAPRDAAQFHEVLGAVWPELAPPREPGRPVPPRSVTPPREKRVFTFSGDSPPRGPSFSVSTQRSSLSQEYEVEEQEQELELEEDAEEGELEELAEEDIATPTSSLPPSQASSQSAGGSPSAFRAHPAPSTTWSPASSPRMTKAAAAHLGIPRSPPCASTSDNGSETSFTPGAPRRPLDSSPASLNPPAVAPRSNKAALLRAHSGTSVPDSVSSSSTQDKLERLKRDESEIFANTPGHKYRRASLLATIPSTLEPSVSPRTNRAAALRQDKSPVNRPMPGLVRHQGRESLGTADRGLSVSGELPGYKRSIRIAVASTRPPELAVRANRTMALRNGGGAESPASSVPWALRKTERRQSLDTVGRAFAAGDVPGYKRNIKVEVASTRPPEVAVRPTRASQLREAKDKAAAAAAEGGGASPGRNLLIRAKTSMGLIRGLGRLGGKGVDDEGEDEDAEASADVRQTFEGVPGHQRAAPLAPASSRAPTITPRSNRAAALRSGQQHTPPAGSPQAARAASALGLRSCTSGGAGPTTTTTTTTTTPTKAKRVSLAAAPRSIRAAALRAAVGSASPPSGPSAPGKPAGKAAPTKAGPPGRSRASLLAPPAAATATTAAAATAAARAGRGSHGSSASGKSEASTPPTQMDQDGAPVVGGMAASAVSSAATDASSAV